MRFNKLQINEIKSRVNIIDYAKKYFSELASAGADKYKARCCFHNDSNASLIFFEKDQSFYCFGCTKRGDVFDLVAHFEKCDFQEAVNKVAKGCGFNFEPTGSNKVDYSFEDLKELSKASLDGKKYIYGRGLHIDFIEKYGVKWSPHLKALAFPIFNREGPKPDYYFYRLISPYGLRYLIPPAAKKTPFNFFPALRALQHEEAYALYIFEGVFDCLAFLQNYKEEPVVAVALCGLASSDIDYIQSMRSSSDVFQSVKIFWCLDNDEAGHGAQLDLALKFAKLRIPHNYFYCGDYNGHKDYSSLNLDGSLTDTINDGLFASTLDYLLRHYNGPEGFYSDDRLLLYGTCDQ